MMLVGCSDEQFKEGIAKFEEFAAKAREMMAHVAQARPEPELVTEPVPEPTYQELEGMYMADIQIDAPEVLGATEPGFLHYGYEDRREMADCNEPSIASFTFRAHGTDAGVLLRDGPELSSPEAATGRVSKGTEIVVDMFQEIEGEQLRAHICAPANNVGWVTARFIECHFPEGALKRCGCCIVCGSISFVPSANRRQQEKEIVRRQLEILGMKLAHAEQREHAALENSRRLRLGMRSMLTEMTSLKKLTSRLENLKIDASGGSVHVVG